MPKRANLLAVLLAGVPLLGWWAYGLFDLDEGFYGAVTAEMNRRGEWITPFYNGKPWFEKPILLYWLSKPSLAIFGDSIGPRLPSILATLGLYALVSSFAKRRMGSPTAVLAPLVLGSSLLVVAAGRMMLTDPLLDLCLAGAFLTFWESLVCNSRWRILTAALLGLGVLAKGPVALLLFVPVAGWTYWREPSLRPAFRGHWALGTALLALVIASWYVPAYMANGKLFVDKLLIEQNVGRFTGGDAAHTLRGVASLFLYLPILFLGMVPWSGWLPAAWMRTFRPPDAGDGALPLQRYLWTWAFVVFLFFSISGAKLPHYILPLFPPLALLVASYLAARWEPLTQRRLVPIAAWNIALGLIVQGLFAAYYGGLSEFGLAVPGLQAEIHGLSRFVRVHASISDDVAEYQMGRRNKDLGTGKLKIQETSQPSTLMYLDRDVLDTDDWSEILRSQRTVWVLTRANRVGSREVASAGGRLSIVQTPGLSQEFYHLYRLSAMR